MLEEPRLSRNNVYLLRGDSYEKRPVLSSATIHSDLKRTLVAMSERIGLSISQVTEAKSMTTVNKKNYT